MARESRKKGAPYKVVNDLRFTMPTDGVEMLAFVVAEDGKEVHLRDTDGTWIVRREDIPSVLSSMLKTLMMGRERLSSAA